MSKTNSPRLPDYRVGALIKGETKEQSRMNYEVGGAWTNDDGSIRVRLNPCVVLDGNLDGLVITLFPNV